MRPQTCLHLLVLSAIIKSCELELGESVLKKIKAVFLPGKLCDERLWERSITALSNIIDGIFVDLRFQATLEEMISSVNNCCDEKFLLIGFSMGGYVAQEFALRFPEKLLGLILIGSDANAYTEAAKRTQLINVETVKKHGFKRLSTVSLHKFIHPNAYENAELLSLIQDMSEKSGSATFISQHLASINRRSRLSDLSKLICPTFLIAARHDQVVNILDIERMAIVIPNSKLFIIENSGHMIPLESPTILNNVIHDWVRDTFLFE